MELLALRSGWMFEVASEAETNVFHETLHCSDFVRVHDLLFVLEKWFLLVLICPVPKAAKTLDVYMLWNPLTSGYVQ